MWFFCCNVAIIFFLMLKTFLHFAPFATELRVNHCRAIFWGVFEPSNWASLAATVATYLAKWEANRKKHKVLNHIKILDDIEATEVSKVYTDVYCIQNFMTRYAYEILCIDFMFHVCIHAFHQKAKLVFHNSPRRAECVIISVWSSTSVSPQDGTWCLWPPPFQES